MKAVPHQEHSWESCPFHLLARIAILFDEPRSYSLLKQQEFFPSASRGSEANLIKMVLIFFLLGVYFLKDVHNFLQTAQK